MRKELHVVADRVLSRARTLAANRMPPIDPFEIAQALGIDVLERPLQGSEGMLVRVGDRASIAIDPSLFAAPEKRSRLRFTLAHEIAHLLVDDVEGTLPRGRKTLAHEERERLCDIVASHLLMPREWLAQLLRDAQREPESWSDGGWVQADSATRLRKLFGVSLPAVANALRELSPTTVFLRFDDPSRIKTRRSGFADERLRVTWSSPTADEGKFVFPGQALNPTSALGKAAAARRSFVGQSSVSWRPIPNGCYYVSGAPTSSNGDAKVSYLVTVCMASWIERHKPKEYRTV